MFIFPVPPDSKEIGMRLLLAIAGIVTLALFVDIRPSDAQVFRHYPWCLFSGGNESSFESCSFDSFEQCLMTRSGGGGICFANPAYRPGVEQPPPKPRRRRA